MDNHHVIEIWNHMQALRKADTPRFTILTQAQVLAINDFGKAFALETGAQDNRHAARIMEAVAGGAWDGDKKEIDFVKRS